MKIFRLFVLVLLATLLPLRGVTAATVLCEQQPASHSQVVAHAHGHEMASTAGHDPSHPQHDHGHSGGDKARHCLSSCSAPPLMGEAPPIAPPLASGTTVFPHFAAPAPTFLSDGQERPPRTI